MAQVRKKPKARIIYDKDCPKFKEFYNSKEPAHNAVGIGINLYMLRNISPKTGTFQARIRVQMKWRVPGIADRFNPVRISTIEQDQGPKRTILFNTMEEMHERMDGYELLLDGEKERGLKGFDIQLPQFSTNAVESNIEEWYCYLKNFDSEDPDMVTLQYVENGVYGMLNLDGSWLFPFDVQQADFKITLWASTRYKERYFQALRHPDGVYYERMIRADIPLQDWVLHKPIIAITVEGKGTSNPACSFVASPVLWRKARYYLQHILLRLTIVTSFAVGVFTMPIELVVPRVAIVLTVLLTIVTFSFTVQEDVPRLKYYTFMDVFILGQFAAIVTVAVHVFHMSYWLQLREQANEMYDDLRLDDRNFGYYYGIGWILWNSGVLSCFALYWVVGLCSRQRRIKALFPNQRKMMLAGRNYFSRGLKSTKRPLKYGVPHDKVGEKAKPLEKYGEQTEKELKADRTRWDELENDRQAKGVLEENYLSSDSEEDSDDYCCSITNVCSAAMKRRKKASRDPSDHLNTSTAVQPSRPPLNP